MLVLEEEVPPGTKNDKRAIPMAVIAFINYNMIIGCIWGSFSVLLSPLENRLGISRELSTLGTSAVALSCAICAPFVGVLATRYSLKLVMTVCSICSVAGFILLAFEHSYVLYLAAYFVLLGPGMAGGVVLSASLVTRWFAVGRGKAMGLMTTPIVVGIVPLISAAVLKNFGLSAVYLTLAAILAVSVIANFLIVERPAESEASLAGAHGAAGAKAAGLLSTGAILKAPKFWLLLVAFGASAASSTVIGSHMVPLVNSWGMTAGTGATLLSCYFFSAIAGTIFYGWFGDQVGGARALAILVFVSAAAWLALLSHPPFVIMAVLVGIMGVDGAGAVPVMALALSTVYGRDNFGTAYGLVNLFGLPFSVIGVPLAAIAYTKTGSYATAIACMGIFLAATGLAALSVRRTAQMVPKAA